VSDAVTGPHGIGAGHSVSAENDPAGAAATAAASDPPIFRRRFPPPPTVSDRFVRSRDIVDGSENRRITSGSGTPPMSDAVTEPHGIGAGRSVAVGSRAAGAAATPTVSDPPIFRRRRRFSAADRFRPFCSVSGQSWRALACCWAWSAAPLGAAETRRIGVEVFAA
jgi:hypothetical protein